MRLSKFLPVAAFCAAIVLAPSCSDDIDNGKEESGKTEKLEVKTFTTSRKTDYGNDWIYFSFKEGKEVAVEEDKHATDTSWDIAFNRYNVRTNSGKSGNGKGGALDTGKKEFSEVETVPEGTFVVDADYEITASFTGQGVTTIMSTANEPLSKAIEFAGPPPTYTPTNQVFIVKTADGKYVKLTIDSFYNDEAVSGYITFRYVYQPDGTTNLK